MLLTMTGSTPRARVWQTAAAAVCGALLMGLGGCSGPVKTDTAAVVAGMTVTPSTLDRNETAIVEVSVTNADGQPLADKTVYLVADPNTGGRFSSSVVQTNADGVATTIFTATTPGTVTVSARVEGGQVTRSKDVTINDVTGGSTENGHITLSITPTLIQADGSSSATVTAAVTDGSGNPVPDQTTVKFAAGEKFVDINGDGYWTANVDSLVYDVDADNEWDAIGTIDATVSTSHGVATTTYTAGSTAALVYIKATGGQPGSQYSAEVSLSLTSNDSVSSISLTPGWQQVQVRGTGGIEWAQINAEAFDAHGNRAPQGLAIDFRITAGPHGGEAINGDPVNPVTVFTDASGQAHVTFNAGNISGTARIVARAGTVVSGATQVTVRSGPPAFISVGVLDCNVPSWELVNVTNKITAVVVDQWGNEVPDSTAVWFGTEQGLIEGASITSPVLTSRGVAETFWHSGAPKNDGHVVYWAQTAGGTVVDTSVFIESGPAASGTFLAAPDTLLADGHSKGEVVIEVLDVNGVFMDTDTPIDVQADIGTINAGLIEDGCHTSIYTGDYVAGTLDRDYIVTTPDNGIGAIATIKARVGGVFGFNGTHQVVLLTGRAYSKSSIIDVPLSMNYGTTAPIEVTIKDRWGNPLGGHLVYVTGDGNGGTVTGSPQYTNEYGVASGYQITVTGNQAITSTLVTATDTDPNYGGIAFTVKISLVQ
ncbi:MAG: Ig-like domain-containing protein [candidate division Zixibacteria bacterium]|nr:Ig-like domain-containing protein [candidate division Zixibacteria bacterium]